MKDLTFFLTKTIQSLLKSNGKEIGQNETKMGFLLCMNSSSRHDEVLHVMTRG
jgi:hypothetical protein